MKTIIEDILNVEHGIICHQVNCFGVAGAGLAKQIAVKYPGWAHSYKVLCAGYDTRRIDLLGRIHTYKVSDYLTIASLFGQFGYSRAEKRTDYSAFEKSLLELTFFSGQYYTHPIHFPYKIGCGLAGGDWIIISRLIELAFPSSVICKREED